MSVSDPSRTSRRQRSLAEVEQAREFLMTEDEVRRRVAEIDEIADMPEKGHIEEDRSTATFSKR